MKKRRAEKLPVSAMKQYAAQNAYMAVIYNTLDPIEYDVNDKNVYYQSFPLAHQVYADAMGFGLNNPHEFWGEEFYTKMLRQRNLYSRSSSSPISTPQAEP